MPPRGAPERLAPGMVACGGGSGDHVAARDAVRLANGRMGGRFLGDSPVFTLTCGSSEPVVSARAHRCPPAPDAARTKANRAEGTCLTARRSRPPAIIRGLAGSQPLHHPELGPLPPFDLQALGPHLRGCRSGCSPMAGRMTSSSSRWMARNHRGKPATWSNSSNRPPGRSTRCISATARRSSGWRTATACRPPCRRRHRAAPAPGRPRAAGRPGGPAGRPGVGQLQHGGAEVGPGQADAFGRRGGCGRCRWPPRDVAGGRGRPIGGRPQPIGARRRRPACRTWGPACPSSGVVALIWRRPSA